MEPQAVEVERFEFESIIKEFHTQLNTLGGEIEGIRGCAYNLATPKNSPPKTPTPLTSDNEPPTVVRMLWDKLAVLEDMNYQLMFLREHLTKLITNNKL